jgi:hypothetical protein
MEALFKWWSTVKIGTPTSGQNLLTTANALAFTLLATSSDWRVVTVIAPVATELQAHFGAKWAADCSSTGLAGDHRCALVAGLLQTGR